MLKKLLSLILMISFAGSVLLPSVNAEEVFEAEKFEYKEMQIQVMPEFDYPEKWPEGEPSLLVGYYGTLVNKTGKDFNGAIEFPLPVEDKNFEIYLVAEFPAEDKPEEQRPFEINKEKGVISWKPGKAIKSDESYRFVVEYYANPFEVTDKKQFSFEYVPQAAIEKMDLIVYSPANAQDFSINPKADAQAETEYGEQVYQYQKTNLKSGDAIKLDISYVKEGNESTLSVMSKQQPSNAQNNSGNATEQVLNNGSNGTTDRPIINTAGAIIIGVSIIIAGAFVFFGLRGNQSGRETKSIQKKTTKKNVSKNPVKTASFSKNSLVDEKKRLRQALLHGKIDQNTYEEEMKKLI